MFITLIVVLVYTYFPCLYPLKVQTRCPGHTPQLSKIVGFVSLLMREKEGRKFLFNDALNTFYLRLYGVRHMVKDHSDSEKGNPLPPHRLLFPISSKGSFICTIPQTG